MWLDVQWAVTHRSAHHVAHAEVKAALFIHRVMQTGQLRQSRPLMIERVITETVIRAA